MAATVQIRRWTGATPTKTDITSTNTRANVEDAHTTSGTTNPITIPDSGSNYSFWVTTALYADTAPSGTIDNIRWYTDGFNDMGTGVTCNVATASSYVQATGTVGTTGDELNTTNHTGLNGSPSDAFAYTSASPLSVAGSTTTTGDIGDQVVYQVAADSTAGAGATASEQFTYKYDET